MAKKRVVKKRVVKKQLTKKRVVKKAQQPARKRVVKKSIGEADLAKSLLNETSYGPVDWSKLATIAADGDAYLTHGELAQIGCRLGILASMFTANAKIVAMNTIGREDIDMGIKFTRRDPHTQTRLDNDKVKEKFPREKYPDFYQTINVKGSIAIEPPKAMKEAFKGNVT